MDVYVSVTAAESTPLDALILWKNNRIFLGGVSAENFAKMIKKVYWQYHHLLQGMQKFWLLWITLWSTIIGQFDPMVPQEVFSSGSILTKTFAKNPKTSCFFFVFYHFEALEKTWLTLFPTLVEVHVTKKRIAGQGKSPGFS